MLTTDRRSFWPKPAPTNQGRHAAVTKSAVRRGHFSIPAFNDHTQSKYISIVFIFIWHNLHCKIRCYGQIPPTGPCQSWSPNNPHTLDWLYDSLWLSLLSTCSWCVVDAYTWLALWLSLLSTCSWCVVDAYTWLALWLSLLSTFSWCVVRAYTWLALWLSLLSTCSWCVVRAYTWLSLWLSLSPLHL